MQTKFKPDLPLDEQISLLQAQASSIKEESYYVTLSQSELDARRETFTDNSIQLSEINDELTEIKNEFKDKMKPLQTANADLLSVIKTKQEKRSGLLYDVPNYDTRFMETYDREANLVSSRRLRPEELAGQSRMFRPEHLKTGTGGGAGAN